QPRTATCQTTSVMVAGCADFVMIVLSVILRECGVCFAAMVNVFALSSTAAMMPLNGVARILPPDAATVAGEASASAELLAPVEGEAFFPAASVCIGMQMTTVVRNAAIITKFLCFMCR